ncbi:MAG: TorF family putative porin [Rubrivivax sp.]
MKKSSSLVSLIALAASAAAFAAALALPSVALADLAFNAGAVTEYRYRGISQSRLKPAVQGGVDFDANGFYVGFWGSSIKWIKDIGGNAPAELDFYGGYKGDIVKDSLTYDVGVLTYQYPRHKLATSPNTTEIYGALTYGPATLKYSHSVSNLFGFADSKNSGYLDLSASFEVGPVTLAPHLGYQKVAHNGSFSYTDYSLIVSKEVLKGLTVSGGVVGADTKKIAGAPAYASPAGKDLGKAAAVAGIKVVF